MRFIGLVCSLAGFILLTLISVRLTTVQNKPFYPWGIAITSWDGITAVRSDGKQTKSILTPPEGQWENFHSHVVTPDGQWVIFEVTHDSYSIFRVRTDGTHLEKIAAKNIEYSYTQISPDGEWVVYQDYLNEGYALVKMHIDGTEAQIIVPNSNWQTVRQITPDSQWLIYEANNPESFNTEIYRVSLVNNYPTPENLSQGRAMNPRLSSDGKWLFFTSDRDGYQEVYLQNLATLQLTNISHSEGWDQNGVMSPDGKRIVFESEIGNWEIYSTRLDGSDTLNITQSSTSDDQDPQFSPDGEWVYYESHVNGWLWDIYRVRLDGSRRQNLTHNSPDTVNVCAQFTPDGQWVWFMTGDYDVYNLYQMRPDGTQLKHIATLPDIWCPIQWLSISPKPFYPQFGIVLGTLLLIFPPIALKIMPSIIQFSLRRRFN